MSRKYRAAAFAVASTFLSTAVGAGPGAFEALTVSTSAGPVRFQVEVMSNDADRANGMMFRRELPEGKGMLFDFGSDRVAGFWMRNTYVPLDMVFVRRDGAVVKIHRDAKPLDETVVSSDVPVRGVLEIPAGASARLGIGVGDKVSHPAFDHGP